MCLDSFETPSLWADTASLRTGPYLCGACSVSVYFLIFSNLIPLFAEKAAHDSEQKQDGRSKLPTGVNCILQAEHGTGFARRPLKLVPAMLVSNTCDK